MFISKIKRAVTLLSAATIAIVATTTATMAEATYSELVAYNQHLAQKSDSLSRLVADHRSKLSIPAEDTEYIKAEIVKLEMMLFDLHSERSRLTNRLSNMTPDGVIPSAKQSAQADKGSTARQISSSPLLRKNLSQDDLENLIEAEALEADCSKIFTEYMAAYRRLRELTQLYAQAKNETKAIKHNDEFDQLMERADELSDELCDLWADIYDDKNYAYSMALELINKEYLLRHQTEIIQEVANNMSKVEFCEQSEPALRYDYQKRGQIELEKLIAKELKITGAIDSLNKVSSTLENTPAVEDLSEVVFTKRSFILYEPIKFVSATPYNAANPIPDAVEYQSGVIYRIQFGAYKYEQLPTVFRGVVPMSKDRALGFWTYYGGGYETLEEAEAAVALCKKRGFNRPEVVIWRDGVRRNLYRDPLPKSVSYKVQIEGEAILSEQTKEAIKSGAPDAEVTKVGEDRYIISPIEGQDAVDKLMDLIEEANDELGCTYSAIDSETKPVAKPAVVKPEAKPDVKAEVKTEVKSEVKPEAKSETETK